MHLSNDFPDLDGTDIRHLFTVKHRCVILIPRLENRAKVASLVELFNEAWSTRLALWTNHIINLQTKALMEDKWCCSPTYTMSWGKDDWCLHEVKLDTVAMKEKSHSRKSEKEVIAYLTGVLGKKTLLGNFRRLS